MTVLHLHDDDGHGDDHGGAEIIVNWKKQAFR